LHGRPGTIGLVSLDRVRADIDSIDDRLVDLLGRRESLVKEAATYKRDEAAVRAPDRRAALMARLRGRAADVGLSPAVVDATWTAMIDAFVGLELREHRRGTAATVGAARERPVLVVVGGLPGVGKTTVSGAYVRRTGAAYLRIDTIEQALVDHTPLVRPLGAAGYVLGCALATEQLRSGTRTVVAECVNPLPVTRDAWQRAAETASAALIDVEVVCSDPDEHRRRVESRAVDVPDLVLPTWREVVDREYEPWHRDRLVIDTAGTGPEQGARAIDAAVEPARART
jgi:predicted kinase/chorismate mutase